MRTIIAGSRHIGGRAASEFLKRTMDEIPWPITEVVSGHARGVDMLGEAWAKARGIPVRRFGAQWHELGRRAGFKRNDDMVEYADALVAIWDGRSSGTGHVIETAKRHGLRVEVRIFEPLD